MFLIVFDVDTIETVILSLKICIWSCQGDNEVVKMLVQLTVSCKNIFIMAWLLFQWHSSTHITIHSTNGHENTIHDMFLIMSMTRSIYYISNQHVFWCPCTTTTETIWWKPNISTPSIRSWFYHWFYIWEYFMSCFGIIERLKETGFDDPLVLYM